MWVSLGLIVFKFIVPFLALLPRWAKRQTSHLTVVCVLILVMQYVDIYWLVYPHLNEHSVIFGIPESFDDFGLWWSFPLASSELSFPASVNSIKRSL